GGLPSSAPRNPRPCAIPTLLVYLQNESAPAEPAPVTGRRAPAPTPAERAEAFLRVSDAFRLGVLPTEQPHPATRELSRWARHDLPAALAALKDVDLRALDALQGPAVRIDRLARRVRDTLARGGRVFLCGCGATGRLSLSLESLWRRRYGHGPGGADGPDRVVSFMAGGDVALVHA